MPFRGCVLMVDEQEIREKERQQRVNAAETSPKTAWRAVCPGGNT